MSTPVAILTGLDHVLRDVAIGGLLADTEALVSVRNEVDWDQETTRLRRLVVDTFGVVEDGWHVVEEPCVTCAVREDAIRTLARLRDSGRWPAVVYTPPAASTALPFCTAFDSEMQPHGRLEGLHLAAVAAIADLVAVEAEVLGDTMLADRQLALSVDDRRSVGEVSAALMGHADLVITDGSSARGSALLDHLRAVDGTRLDGATELRSPALFSTRHLCRQAAQRLDPRHVQSSGRPETESVWTLDLHSDRPFHPKRLLQNIEQLGGRRVRSRGRFWLPDRPGSVCSWDGAGAQLSIGDVGAWHSCAPSTRLIFTGTDEHRPALVTAFEDSLATASEMGEVEAYWAGSSDVLGRWL